MGRVYVGTAGWSYRDWEGIVYPPRKPRGFSPLGYLADYFDAVEVNNTFYRPPSPQAAEGWLEQTRHREDFHFTLKLWRRFTHQREEPWSAAEVDTFRAGIDPLAEAGRLGGLLLQFPWSFRDTPENRDWLSRLAREFAEYRLFAEVRHGSWGGPDAYEFLRSAGLNFCNIDQPVLGRSIEPSAVVTGPAGYVRLHGRNYEAWFAEPEPGRSDQEHRNQRYNYLYSEAELDEWVDRIHQLIRRADSVYVFTNNHYRGQAPANALQLRAKITGHAVAVPPPMLEHFPFLRAVAAPPPASESADRQHRLF